jgi:hypothetical protein
MRPEKPGWWWAIWKSKAEGTADPDDEPGPNPEIVEVIENCIDETDPEYLGVFVGGVGNMQFLENFEWLRMVRDQKA